MEECLIQFGMEKYLIRAEADGEKEEIRPCVPARGWSWIEKYRERGELSVLGKKINKGKDDRKDEKRE